MVTSRAPETTMTVLTDFPGTATTTRIMGDHKLIIMNIIILTNLTNPQMAEI